MDEESTTGAPSGLFRRLAALFYDLLLVVALAFVATSAMLPLTQGQAILSSTQGLIGHLYRAILLLVVFTYFGWCWTRTGQTLGLKAWHIRLRRKGGGKIGWVAAFLRYLLGAGLAWLASVGAWYLWRAEGPLMMMGAAALLAPLLLNFAWVAIDREGRSLMDVVGRTQVLRGD